MTEYTFTTTLDDGTVLQSRRWSNKAFRAINETMVKNKVSLTKLGEDLSEIVQSMACFDEAVAIMFEIPWREYCKERKLDAKMHTIQCFMDDIMPNELMRMKTSVLSWYTEAFDALKVGEKNAEAVESDQELAKTANPLVKSTE